MSDNEQELKDMRAELHVALRLLRLVLEKDIYETEDGDCLYLTKTHGDRASDDHERAWNFVMNPFDKDDYLDLL